MHTGTPDTPIDALLPTGLAETVLYSGRAINRLARDKNVIEMTGRVTLTHVPTCLVRFTNDGLLCADSSHIDARCAIWLH